MQGNISFVDFYNRKIPVGSTNGASVLATWLDSDIQGSKGQAKDWLTKFSEIKNGTHHTGFLGTGNTYTIMATDCLVLIECEYANTEKILLEIDQICLALSAYFQFLDNRAAQDFEISYIAEGESALTQYVESGGELGE